MSGADAITSVEGIADGRVFCPICAGLVSNTVPAVIADFVRIRCEIPRAQQGQAHFCVSCDHMFYTPFLLPDQLTRLYGRYQSDSYNKERITFEPNYEPLIEEFENKGSSHWRKRSQFYSTCMDIVEPAFVVDFGGGDGWMANVLFPRADVVVVDEDFERKGGDLAAALGRCDLLFAAHVFEHLPDPSAQLARLTRHLRPGTTVWIEVPKEYAHHLADRFGHSAQTSNEPSSAPSHVMHEHIAHFSRRSLTVLAQGAGLAVERYAFCTFGLQAVTARKT